MPAQYKITEPHPSAGKYLYSGRGGAGNSFKAPKTTNPSTAAGPASLFGAQIPQTGSKFSAGRGGAGNIHPNSERASFSFDEELARQSTREKRLEAGAVYHVGRGGAGNYASTRSSSSRKDSSSSADSTGSGRAGFFSRLSQTFERS